MSRSVTGRCSSGSITRSSALRIASRSGVMRRSVGRTCRRAVSRTRARGAGGDALAHLVGAAATTRERPREVEGRRPRTADPRTSDRHAALSDEELGSGDVDRPRRLERADRVDAAGREVAERQCERAHHAEALRYPRAARRRRRCRGRGPSKERISTRPSAACRRVRPSRWAAEAVLGRSTPRRCRSRGRSRIRHPATSSRPRPRSRGAVPQPALRVHRPVDRVDDDDPRPTRPNAARRAPPRRG